MNVPTKRLFERIEALPPEKRAEVADFVEFLATRGQAIATGGVSDEFLRRIDERRERLRGQYGLYDSVATIRELRENDA
jgi:hypothetical protein